jgi:tRNA (guanine-N7-)-methyltransferase
MSRQTRVATARGLEPLFPQSSEIRAALPAIVPGAPAASAPPEAACWEVEIGFGKGRYLLRRAAEEPARRFLGIEIASEYFRLAARRVARRRLTNVVLLDGEAQYLATAVLPRGFARAVHVYFPDPWPKQRHRRRRLFSPDSVDLVLGLLAPGGRLFFATDFLTYGEEVRALLASHPGVEVAVHDGPWTDGARTNYEAKYLVEGRPILRLEVTRVGEAAPHPRGTIDLLVAPALRPTPLA